MAKSVDGHSNKPSAPVSAEARPKTPLESEPQKQGQVESERAKALRRSQQQDAARWVSQTGSAGGAAWNKSKLGTGDYRRQPIPLDPSDVDADQWSPQALERASEQLTLKASVLKEAVRLAAGKGVSLPTALIGSVFKPTEDDVEKLKALVERDAELAERDLGNVQQHLATLFEPSLEAPPLPPGRVAMAAALFAGGLGAHVSSGADGELCEESLARGASEILERGRAAFEMFRRMQRGIHREVSALRTLVPRR